ncbi:MAG: SPOR domain-containing protein [Candidatus Accumulibacter sp.]|jgi:hypothetical protein|nr:SPOR domain-containing protein [Accumulibacter sp.]
MRIAVFLLVLANLLFFTWSRGHLGSGESNPLRAGEPLRADRIRLVSNDRPPASVREVSALSAEETRREVCAVLSDISQAHADALERLFTEELPTFRRTRTDTPGSIGYWVHIPPFKTRREAESKVAELRNLGVTDYFILSEGGDSFAISLGLFSTRAAAESSLATLRGKGVRSARLGERPRRLAASRIEFLGPEARAGEMRRLIGQVLPQTVPGDCAPGAAGP